MAARIKHVAIVSSNVAPLSEFYEAAFGMKRSGEARPGAAVVVTDGYVGMNINPRAPGRQAGFDHFGLEVDDVEAVFARVRDDYPDVHYLKRPANRPFAGISIHDPAGNVFDLSQAGMENRRGLYTEVAGEGEQNPRHISHFMLRTVDPTTVARFYSDVFGLRPRSKDADDPNYYLTDEVVTLVIAPWRIADYEGSGIERPALDHLGFQVESLEQFQADLAGIASRSPALAPMPTKPGPEGEARQRLLAACRYGEHRLADPDGVLLDVHEH
jgi:predicted enzyme related to lactoylglutathione lyase